jgi:hypothetical protein
MLNHHYQQSVVEENGQFDDTTANVVSHLRQQNSLPEGSNVDHSVWQILTGGGGGSTQQGDGQQHAQQGDAAQHGQQGQHGDPAQQGQGQPGDGQGAAAAVQPVDFPLTLMSQPDDTTCWAASMVMVLNGTGENLTVEELCTKNNVDHQGKTYSEALPIGTAMGMHEVYCACWMESGWAEVLSANGPLWTPVPGNEYHIIVVAGIRPKDGGSAEIHVYDPWPPGSGAESWMDFATFTQTYEMGEGYGGNLLAH